MIIYEVFNRQIAWPDKTVPWVMQQVCNENARPDIPKDMPENFVLLLKRCWEGDPKKRPTFNQIVHELEETRKKVGEQIEEMWRTLEVGKGLNSPRSELMEKEKKSSGNWKLFSPRTSGNREK